MITVFSTKFQSISEMWIIAFIPDLTAHKLVYFGKIQSQCFSLSKVAAFQSVMLCIFTPCRRTALTLLHLLELKAVNLLDDTT